MVRFKLVKIDEDGALRSFFNMEIGSTIYKVGEWQRAPEPFRSYGYYFYVFDSMENAKDFVKNLLSVELFNYKLYSCYVKGRHRTYYLPFMLDINDISNRNKLINELIIGSKNRTYSYKGMYPFGTEMWEYVKLNEEINLLD